MHSHAERGNEGNKYARKNQSWTIIDYLCFTIFFSHDNNYLVFGTLEKNDWLENIHQPKSFDEMRQHMHDFIS
jgi:hypothetical protein